MDVVEIIKPKRFFCSSSASVYGPHSDMQGSIVTEDTPMRPLKEFNYANHKVEVEVMLKEFEERNRGTIVTSYTRAVGILGPHINHYYSRVLLQMPIVVSPGKDVNQQLVHEEDIVNAIILILEKNVSGCFNVAAQDTLSMKEFAKMRGIGYISVPFFLIYILVYILWSLRVSEIPPIGLYLNRYEINVDSSKLNGLGFKYKYTTKQTMEEFLRIHNKLN